MRWFRNLVHILRNAWRFRFRPYVVYSTYTSIHNSSVYVSADGTAFVGAQVCKSKARVFGRYFTRRGQMRTLKARQPSEARWKESRWKKHDACNGRVLVIGRYFDRT